MMNTRAVLLAASLLGLTAWGAAQDRAAPQRDQFQQTQGVEVLTHGQIHEAYARPTDPHARPQPVVPRQPPDPLPELPPDARPEGNNVVWIPGYWGWDDDSQNFLWVSGFWRNEPPNQRWVTGYWQQSSSGWVWVPGFWTAEQSVEVQYVPEPPAVPPEAVPPAPNETSIFVPGIWVWRDTTFYWRPGYWVDYQPDWVFVSAQYNWTPYGYVYVDGYWDYPLHERGLLFAPVRVAADVVTANWTYTPSYVIAPDAVLSAMFVNTATRSYYFGDYFDARYSQRGYVPWVDYRIGRSVYDANFAYYHTAFRNAQWDQHLHALYTARREGTIPRPPRTLAEQTTVINNINQVNVQNVNVLRNFNVTNVQDIVQVASPLNQVRELRTQLAAPAGRTGADPRANAATNTTIRIQPLAQDVQTRCARRPGSTTRPSRRAATPRPVWGRRTGARARRPKPPTRYGSTSRGRRP